MLDTAWSTLDIKSIDRTQRIIEGIASTPSPDRGGDVMEPKGAQFTLPMPLKWQHDHSIGEVFAATVKADGIHIRAKMSTLAADAPDILKARIEEAWHSVIAKPPLARGLSIGWSPIEAEPIKGTRFTRFIKWVWGETSVVAVPMNADATITAIKSFDQSSPAASGTGSAVIPPRPGVTGSRRDRSMTISEQLTEQKAVLQTKHARLAELEANDDANGGLDADDTSERETLTKEVPTLTAKVGRLSMLEAAQANLAGGIYEPTATQRATPSPRTPTHQFKTVDLPKGTLFTRYAMSVAAGKGSMSDTLAYAKRFTDTPEVLRYVKASLEGTAVVGSPAWGGELVNPDTAMTEFVDLVRAQTIIGRVNGFRTVPFNIPIVTQTGGSTFGWVGEGGVKPVGELAFTRTTMSWSKVAGIIVLSDELIRLSRPDAEATVRRDLTEQCALFIDQQFIQVAVAAGANNPASVTNGVASPAASGTTLAAAIHDLNVALGTFDTAGISTDGLVIVTTPAVARILASMTNPLGQPPNGFSVSPNGGTLYGYPVVVSASVDAGTLVIMKPSEIFLADDGRVTLDASNQATLDMNSGSSPTFNLWQRNCTGIRAERWIRWQKRMAAAVAVIDTIAYVPGT